ncbi:MAG TPA: phosphotransferase [Gammaproteobacteria bacterium]|nr:phosphotransferase [Gammaproteobacteria bacterium]
MTQPPHDRVVEALRRMLPDRDPAQLGAARYSALAGGVNRRTFLVEVGADRWVLQLPMPGAPALLDVATEAEAMRAASAAGLAPAVVAVDAASATLLTEYRAGAAAWTPADAREPANIARAARLLRALHAVQVPIPPYGAERITRGYLAALAAAARAPSPAPEVGDCFGARGAAWADELVELARNFDACHPPTALCHNDLAAANFLDGGGELLLVDFEYAARASPLLDLAGLAAMNGFTAPERRRLLEVYGDAANAPATPAELDRVVRMVRLMSYFWAALGAQRAPDPGPYLRLAAELRAELLA